MLDDLFASTSEDDVEFGFDALRQLTDWYDKEATKADEQMGRRRPPVARRTKEDVSTPADDWTAAILAAQAEAEAVPE